MDFVNLGANVRKLRKEQGLTQEKLAELSDISIAYLSKIENNKANNVSLLITYRLAEALGVTAGYLVGQSDLDKMLDEEILNRLADCSSNEKKKILKIMDILREDE
ncbi:MAG: helix-turn-helix domain-containing protein [Coprococcus sp.]